MQETVSKEQSEEKRNSTRRKPIISQNWDTAKVERLRNTRIRIKQNKYKLIVKMEKKQQLA